LVGSACFVSSSQIGSTYSGCSGCSGCSGSAWGRLFLWGSV
jgi:hypothetical protein